MTMYIYDPSDKSPENQAALVLRLIEDAATVGDDMSEVDLDAAAGGFTKAPDSPETQAATTAFVTIRDAITAAIQTLAGCFDD